MVKPLREFKLYYEDMEHKTMSSVKAKPQKVAVKKPLIKKFTDLKTKFIDVVNKTKNPRKKTRKLTKLEQKAVQEQRKRGILGIGLLLVVVSIAYSTYIVRTFVDTNLSLVSLIPQVSFALYTLLRAFSKLYK